MTTVLIAAAVFALAVLGLSVGVIFKKRTPLKGSCHSADENDGGGQGACASCTCKTGGGAEGGDR